MRTTRATETPSNHRALGTLLLALGLLTAVYVVVIALGDSRAWSGSDAGGRVAAVRELAESGAWVPDVGYWAEDLDPDGAYHPLLYTRRLGQHWVNVTSLPLVYAAVPLWHLAGPTGILVLPVLGALLAATAARRLALALGARHGWTAFWLVGLGSPMVFYAGDFWEHSLAVGVGLWVSALLVERIDQAGGTPARVWVIGCLFGVAGVLRTELLVYAAAMAIAVLLVSPLRRAWMQRPARIVVGVVGFATPLLANQLLERAVLEGTVRSARAGSNVSEAGTQLGERLSNGLLTTVAVFPDRTVKSYVVGTLFCLGLLLVALAATGRQLPPQLVRVGAGGVLGILLGRFASGPGFVPGVLPAAPIAPAGLIGTSRPVATRAIVLAATLALPLVWMFQWLGDIAPQWGGRYVLLTGGLLTVVGAVTVEGASRRMLPAAFLITTAAAMSVFGAVWHVQRTRDVARAAQLVEAAPRDVVLVTDVRHLPREFGAFYGQHRWLMATNRADLHGAMAVAAAGEVRRVDLVQLDDAQRPLRFDGYRLTTTRRVPFLGIDLVVRRYVAVPA